LIGGNLCTFNLLQGTPYSPSLKGAILAVEDDDLIFGSNFAKEFDRNLTSLIQQPDFSGIKGVLIGRFQRRADMTIAKVKEIVASKKELKEIPIIANLDFGHTTPQVTLPIGGRTEIVAGRSKISVRILQR